MSARRIIAACRLWLGVRACAKGRHAPLEWFRYDERAVPVTNAAMEMTLAAGMGRFMKYNGFCPRCHRAVEWSSVDPRTPAERKAQRMSRSAHSTPQGAVTK